MENYSGFRVLSIDWDYFVEASHEERCFLFPDGGQESIGHLVSNMIWSHRFASARVFKEKGKIPRSLDDLPLKNDFGVLERIINYQDSSTRVYIAESHATAYYLIKDLSSSDNIEIYNIDFHHDMYKIKGSEELNCGNWICHVQRDFPNLKTFWVKDEHSEMKGGEDIPLLTIEDLKYKKFDFIFLCKSSVWSPIHLDTYFLDLVHNIHNKFEYVVKDKDSYLLSDRFNALNHIIKQETEIQEVVSKSLEEGNVNSLNESLKKFRDEKNSS